MKPRCSLARALLLVLLLGLLLVPGAPAQATDAGRVRGTIVQGSGAATPRVELLWFRSDWTYLGRRKISGGGYSLQLAPGRYFLQFVDQRPAYDVTKSRPTTVSVVVSAGRTTAKNVRMVRGASIGGAVRAGGKPAGGARVVAANTGEQSFETTADAQGRYALGGLPPGTYSVFTYDKRKTWVAKSTYLGKVRGSRFRTLDIALRTRGGNLLVDLSTGSSFYRGSAYVTAVSRKTGQFWTAKAVRGSVTFRGLYPGRYRVQVPGLGNYFPATVNVAGRVRPGKTAFGNARLTKRGAWVTGSVVNAGGRRGLEGATVRLLAADGRELDRTTSTRGGAFTLDGQLTTQSGLTVVAGPGPYSPYLDNCPYRVTRVSGVAITTNRATALGEVGLVLTDDAPQQCQPPRPSPGPAMRRAIP